MHYKMLSAICFNLDQSKKFASGNGLNSDMSNKKAFPTNVFNYHLLGCIKSQLCCEGLNKTGFIVVCIVLTHSQTKNFRLFKTQKSFVFDENGGKFSKRVKNTVGKEIWQPLDHDNFFLLT